MKTVGSLFITVVCAASVLFTSSFLHASDGKKIATVSSIDRKKGEVIARYASAETPMKIGDKVYVRVNEKPVVLETVFPMMTTCRLKPAAGQKSLLASIQSGADIFRYVPGIENETAPSPAPVRTRPAAPVASSPGKHLTDAEIAALPASIHYQDKSFTAGTRIVVKSRAGTFKPVHTGYPDDIEADKGRTGTVLCGYSDGVAWVRWDRQLWNRYLSSGTAELGPFDDTIHIDYLEVAGR